MTTKRTKYQQEMRDGTNGRTPADFAAAINRRSVVSGAAAVMTAAALTPEARAQAPKEIKIVLTGIARSKGKAAGEALVNSQRMGWAFNHVGN